ncbi:MAG: DMT family transporter [Aliivibrio sp.]|uniref:DMT family transporter n=1 Tax=Aliivibrio sp. TaxID=1872443 RepID=UPI001A58417B|nr:DMT family transporter [Aliivibrio sp.]
MRTVFYTLAALIAFAGNSVLCRLALGDESIDASSFTSIRLISGAVVLLIIVSLRKSVPLIPLKGSIKGSFLLFLYAVSFSFAYVSLDTATGALILFAAVQLTIILVTLYSGHRFHISEWFGLIISFIGFVYLVMPSVQSPPLFGSVLMTISGIAWAGYTLLGKASTTPLFDTLGNFSRTIPFALVMLMLTIYDAQISQKGVILAVLSGSIASGVGYTIWYMALNGLSATQAAVVQLLVPILAAFGGVIFVGEQVSSRLVISSLLVLGGILIVVMGRNYFTKQHDSE